LVCPLCSLNNRQRLVATIVKSAIAAHVGSSSPRVYVMEQVTPLYAWFRHAYGADSLIGSEYIDSHLTSGTYRDGIRHEDAENLSLESGSMDIVVSNDVLEHVNDPWKALHECARVLRSGGTLYMTIPFFMDCESSRRRASATPDGIEHILPAVYHGNPLSSQGSLVFTDFGWDVLDEMRRSGFRTAETLLAWNPAFGHLGGAQIVFKGCRT